MRIQEQTEKLLAMCEPNTTFISTYINSKSAIKATCIQGHIRSIIPSNLVTRGSGGACLECKGTLANNKKTTAKYIQELADTSKGEWTLEGEYLGSLKKHKFICKNGHEYLNFASEMINKPKGCRVCTPIRRSDLRTNEEFQTILDDYALTLVTEYTGAKNVVLVSCSKGHEYSILPSNLVSYGTGAVCNICNPSYSKPQEEVLEYIRQFYKGDILVNDRTLIKPLEIDIILVDLGICIEINGDYYHSSKYKTKMYHRDKTNAVEACDFQLIHISEYDWVNIQDIVKSRLKSILGVSNKIYARQCEIRVIDYPKKFLDENHLQGAGAPSSVNYGLYYQNELVAVMTFSKNGSTSKILETYHYALIRYCSKLNTTVVGGASKLLKRFLLDHPGKDVCTYAARDWSVGSLYEKLGFTKIQYTDPGYYYFKDRIKLLRYGYTKNQLKQKMPEYYNDKLSEEDIMKKAGYYKVYNSGNISYGLRNLRSSLS